AGQRRRGHPQPAPGQQLRGRLQILGGEGQRPDALALGVEIGPHALAERPVPMRRDDVQRHVGELEPGVARAAVAADPVGLAPQQPPVAVHRRVQVADRQRHVVDGDNHRKSRTSAMRPAMAAAAAIGGLIRWVRPARPWRPSKLRLEVDAQRWPGGTLSGFIARHMEHPGSRHSKPAARKTSSSPSASAWARTRPEPGTTMARTCGATVRPSTIFAVARRSSMRLLVQEPMNTTSTLASATGWPASRPMYSRARSAEARLSGLAKLCGSGTRSVTATTSSGLVPQVTSGAILAASSTISRSQWASSSEKK